MLEVGTWHFVAQTFVRQGAGPCGAMGTATAGLAPQWAEVSDRGAS
jgi:hypothetical protein